MKKLGLIGYPLGHSFSKKFYHEKFKKENIQGIDYDLYAIPDIKDFQRLYLDDHSFYGFNVTIPHKQAVLHYIDELSDEALEMQAVNCIRIEQREGKPFLKGFNTDAYGFEESIKPLLKPYHKQALVLGNGGAAKAVFYSLKKLNIPFKVVSRTLTNGDLTYEQLNEELVQQHQLIINCSPIGSFPDVDNAPQIPYEGVTENHLLYDLIYNPEETEFLKRGRIKGAATKNGYEMLLLQAEKNWEIWNAAD